MVFTAACSQSLSADRCPGYSPAHVLEVFVSLAVALASLGPVDDAIERARVEASGGDIEAAIETIRGARETHDDPDPVSYTHLTLPTIYSV